MDSLPLGPPPQADMARRVTCSPRDVGRSRRVREREAPMDPTGRDNASMHATQPRRLTRSHLVALAASLLATAPAAAQPMSRDLPLVEMHDEVYSGIDTAQTRVIQSLADYRAFFAGSNINVPLQPRVDFATEDLLVAAMGMKSSGGYAIEITRVELMTGGFTGGHAFVDVVERAPAPGQPVTMALTSPIHVVKVPKGAIAYHFRTAAPAAMFTALDLDVTSPAFGTSERIVLQADGKAQLLRSSPTARYMPIDGAATAAELQAVVAAFRAADVATLPATIDDPNVYIVAPTKVALESTVGGQTHRTEASLGVYDPYDARVRPLVDALRAIATRLAAGPGTFERIHLVYSGGFAMFSEEITIEDDGTAVVVRHSHIGAATKYFNGQATPAELQAIVDAVNAADVATLPAVVDDPTPVADVPSVTITTTLSGQDHTTRVVEAGFYDAYAARLAPMVDAVRAVVDRLLDPPAQEFTGRVRLVAGRYLFLGSYFISGADPLALAVYRGLGRQVTVKGFVSQQGSLSRLDLRSVQGVTTVNLNLRVDPRVGATVITVLPRGTTVEITDLSADRAWYTLDVSGQTGWSSAHYVRVGR